jgi:glucoamylase
VDIRNRPGVSVPAVAVVGMEFLYLTRLGLRAAADDRIRDSLHVAEAVLGHDLPTGRAYYRYNDDGYGEGPGGTPFTGLGQGRPWPLLAGERGHHAVVAGDDALPQLAALLAMRGRGGLVPEQVWDDDDIPSLDLYRGRPTGSAMPLVWGHAELVSLAVARHTGRAANHVDAVDHRYGGAPPEAPAWYWRDQAPVDVLPRGRDLVVEAVEPFVLHFGHDGWRDPVDREAAPLGFGMWGVTVTGAESTPWSSIELTRHFASGWEGRDHPVQVSETPPMHLRGLEALVPT